LPGGSETRPYLKLEMEPVVETRRWGVSSTTQEPRITGFILCHGSSGRQECPPHLSTAHVGEGLVPSRMTYIFHAVVTGAHEGLPYNAGQDARPTLSRGYYSHY
jgi:hypothetical protein